LSTQLLEAAVRLHRSGRRAEALQVYSQILRQDPRNFYALYFLGFGFFEEGDFARSAEWIEKAVEVNPHSPDALYNLGCALQKLQRHGQAISRFDAAIAIKADYAAAWTNRGAALLALRRHLEALASFDRALCIDPQDAEALSNRATVWFEMQCYDRAAEDYARLLEVAPEFPDAIGNLALARAYCCDWRFTGEDCERITAGIRSGNPVIAPHGSVLLLSNPEDQLLCARRWTAAHAPAVAPLAQARDYDHQKLRIAYVSADFRLHATSMLIAGVLEQHDREQFEIFGFSFGPDDGSALRRRIMAACDDFSEMQHSTDDEIARAIAGAKIDIAVDLKGFTQSGRPGVFARRPAPVQVNYLGHPGTMGAGYIDCIIADEVVIPCEAQRFYDERVVYLPGCYQANDSKRTIASHVITRAEAGLPERAFVFCCFNHPAKITRNVFAIWMRVLQQMEASVLWLLDSNDAANENLRRAAATAGIEPARLVFAPRADPESHLGRHSLADLFLDTLPCCAHTTASDALWAGLPLITVPGTSFAGRVSASLLKALDLPELIARTFVEYEALVLKLARDTAALAAIRSKLAEHRKTHLPFDTARFTRNLESAYRSIWLQR
jgi:predicted O-linked N-acetylglucosamine transferase (SPINDLY family)